MRINIEKTKSITVAVMMVLLPGLISSCQKDALQDDAGTLASDECMIRLTVPESDGQEISTRGAAILEESYIEDLYLLCFDEFGEFKKGEVQEVKNKVTAPLALTTKVIKGTKGTVVLLANSDKFKGTVNEKTTGLNAAMAGKTIDSINTVFSNSWNRFDLFQPDLKLTGRYMPMSSTDPYISRPKVISIQLIRSFAKVQLAYDIKPGNDITGLFTHKDSKNNHTFKVGNYLRKDFNNIYRHQLSPISGSHHAKENFENSTTGIAIIGTLPSSVQKTLHYLPEYPNSKFAKGAGVSSAWNKDRMCIIIKATGSTKTQYFRLDFSKKADDGTYQFLDIERNKHITFTITAVKSNGYATEQEALEAPASNIEYTIRVSEQNQVVNTNGQYAICMTNDGKIIKGGKGKYDVAAVSYQATDGMDLSGLETKSSVTTNMPSGIANARLLFNGVQITQGMAAPPKFVSGSNIIQLVTDDNTGEVDCQVYLSFGNLKDTIVVKRYPYDYKKLELKLTATDVPNMVWDKNEAKVAVSKTMLTVPYRVQKTDARTEGTIAGKFRLGTASAAPVTTHLRVDVVQKGIEGILVRIFTDNDNGKLQMNGAQVSASPTNGIDLVVLPGDSIRVTSMHYTYNDQYYKVRGWSRPVGNSAIVTPLDDRGSLTLIVPYALNNAGDYTAAFFAPVSALVTLTFKPNGYAAADMPLDIPGKIGDQVMIPIRVPAVDKYQFLGWTANQDGTGVSYSSGASYTLKEENNVLYAEWRKKTNIIQRTLPTTITYFGGFILENNLSTTVQYDSYNTGTSFRVTVYGKVNTPSTVNLRRGSNVLETGTNGGWFSGSNIEKADNVQGVMKP